MQQAETCFEKYRKLRKVSPGLTFYIGDKIVSLPSGGLAFEGIYQWIIWWAYYPVG